MKVATSDLELAAFLGDAADVSPDHPVVVSKFIRNAKEIEFDAVCRDGADSAQKTNLNLPGSRRRRRCDGVVPRRRRRGRQREPRRPTPTRSEAAQNWTRDHLESTRESLTPPSRPQARS